MCVFSMMVSHLQTIYGPLGLKWSIEFEECNRSESSEFLLFRIVSLHNKSNGTRLLLTEADYTNCPTSFLAA